MFTVWGTEKYVVLYNKKINASVSVQNKSNIKMVLNFSAIPYTEYCGTATSAFEYLHHYVFERLTTTQG